MVVIVLLGVLAAVAIPRMVGRTGFEARGFADEVASALRYGQRSAVAMRRPVYVLVSPPGGTCSLRLCLDSGCKLPLINPATNSAFCLRTPALVALSYSGGNVSFSFSASGRPTLGATYTVSSSAPGVSSRIITVEAESGYVR